MAPSSSAFETEAPQDLSPAQLSELAGGYEHSEPQVDTNTTEATTPSDAEVAAAIDQLTRSQAVKDKFFALLERAKEKAGRKAGALTAATVLGLLLAACGPNADPGATPTVSTSAEPTAEPTETEAPVEVPEKFDFNVSQADIEGYLGESQDAFLSRPEAERALVALYYAQDMPEFAADWSSVSKNPLDELTAPLSVNMTPQQIVTFTGYMHRIPYTLPAADDYNLDTNAANKMIAGTFTDPTSNPAYPVFINQTDAFANDGGAVGSARTLAASRYLEMSSVNEEHTSELLEDAEGQYRIIRVVNADSQVFDITYRWVVASNNVGVWLEDEQTQVQ